MLDTHDSLVAWLPRANCGGVHCPLHLTDVATGDDQALEAPAGSGRWVRGGAISPEGRTLAAFVDASPATFADGFSGPGASLVLVDIPTATVTQAVDDSVVAVGEPVVAAAWSPTSGWLFFSGLRNPMRGYEPGSTAAVPLSLPASYAFAVA